MYYHNIWDPVLIISQISLLQGSFYLFFGINLCVSHLLFGSTLSLGSLLDGDAILMSKASGWTIIIALMITAFAMSWCMLHVVGRAKKCLDFTATLYLIHYLISWLYAGIPSSWQYYLTIAIAFGITVGFSEYLCVQEEMKWIPVSQSSQSDSSSSQSNKQEIELTASRSNDAHIDIDDPDVSERVGLINGNKAPRIKPI